MLGYLPQDFGYYPEFTGEDFLLYMAALKGITQKVKQLHLTTKLLLISESVLTILKAAF